MRQIERKRAKQSDTRLRSASIDELMTPSAIGETRNKSQSVGSEDQYFDSSPTLKVGDENNSNEAIIPQADEFNDGAQACGHLILPSSEKVRNQVLQLLKVVNSI